MTPPPHVKSKTTTSTNSNLLTQQFQIVDMNENQVYPNTVEADSVLDKLKLAATVCCAKSELLRSKLCTEMPSQQQPSFVAALNSHSQTSTSGTTQPADDKQVTTMASAELAAICQHLMEKPDLLNTSQPFQPVNTPVTGTTSQNLSSFSSLLSDAALMTAVSQLKAAAYMQYQFKIQQMSAPAESFDQLLNYINYIKMISGVPVSQSQPQSSDLVIPTNDEQQQHYQNLQQLQSQGQSQFTFPNYSFPTFSLNPFVGCDLNLNSGQWLDYMRLLAIQSSSAGLYMPSFTTSLWNPLSLIALQNACTSAPAFPDLQKQLSDLITQRNCDNICGSDGAQHPNDLEVAEILAAFSNMPSAQ